MTREVPRQNVYKTEDIIMAKSNAFTVAQLKSLPTGKHCDGLGLWLYKRPDGGAQWIFRFQL